MTVQDILADVDLKYPNDVETEHKWAWITQLEKMLVNECFLTHELTEQEQAQAEIVYAMENAHQDYKPLAQPPYQDIYIHYLGMQIALVNVDNDQYENEQTLYNNALLAYKNWFSRNHRAKLAVDKWRF